MVAKNLPWQSLLKQLCFFQDPRVKSESTRPSMREDEPGFQLVEGDEMENFQAEAAEVVAAELCADGTTTCGTIPPKNFLKLKYGYDDTWFNSFDGDTASKKAQIKAFIDSMITHMQVHFCHVSLGTEITLEVKSNCNSDFNCRCPK
jgi:hypothetical protein